MNIIYRTGSFLDATDTRYFLHGCNAQGVMGSGAAKAVRTRYPNAYKTYRMIYEALGLTVGEVITHSEKDVTIFNCITQQNYGTDGRVYASLDAIEECIRKVDVIMSFTAYPEKVSMPAIGSGLGGLCWEDVERVIEQESTCFIPVVYVMPNQKV